MTATHPTLADVISAELDALAVSGSARQVVSGGHENLAEVGTDDGKLREQAWRDLAAQYPDVLSGQTPPAPETEAAALQRLDFDSGRIVFNNGVPVGGNSHLTLFSDGTYAFTGHFHVSGAPSYNDAIVWVIKDQQGRPFTFSHSGRLHGTFESGSRDDDWAITGSNAMIAQLWPTLVRGSWYWKAAVNINIGALIDSALKAVGTVGAVIAVVA